MIGVVILALIGIIIIGISVFIMLGGRNSSIENGTREITKLLAIPATEEGIKNAIEARKKYQIKMSKYFLLIGIVFILLAGLLTFFINIPQ